MRLMLVAYAWHCEGGHATLCQAHGMRNKLAATSFENLSAQKCSSLRNLWARQAARHRS